MRRWQAMSLSLPPSVFFSLSLLLRLFLLLSFHACPPKEIFHKKEKKVYRHEFLFERDRFMSSRPGREKVLWITTIHTVQMAADLNSAKRITVFNLCSASPLHQGTPAHPFSLRVMSFAAHEQDLGIILNLLLMRDGLLAAARTPRVRAIPRATWPPSPNSFRRPKNEQLS